MKVLKFGGTSIGSIKNITKVKEIIGDLKEQAIIVVSAFGGITNLLIETAEQAALGKASYLTSFEKIQERHIQLAAAVVPEEIQRDVLEAITATLADLNELLTGVSLVKEISPKTKATILSYGELLSSYILSFAFEATHIQALDLIKTESNKGKNILDVATTNQLIKEAFTDAPQLSIISGFIATSSENGEITNLGRGGSDYTGAIIAAALDASILEIWTDVDGFLTADPRLVKNAYTINELSYIEAMELSNFGAKVIYPPSIYPVYSKDIPVLIKNTENAKGNETLIHKHKNPEGKAIKGISSIQNTCLITIQGFGMVGVLGISSRTFSALSEAGISVFLISQASSENSTTFAVLNKEKDATVKALNEEFKKELKRGDIDTITPEEDLATVAIVGENMKHNTGIAGKLFNTLGRSGINIIACAQGASETNISFVIKMKDLHKSLNSIHDSFFLSDYQVLNIFQVGTGTVGGSLLDQIHHQQEKILKQNRVKLNVVSLTGRKRSVFKEEGINLDDYKKVIKEDGVPMNLEEVSAKIIELNMFNSVFVDCTASADVAGLYENLLKHNVSVVAANKIAASGSYAHYHNLKQIAREKGIKYLYETNVGAGLPILNTMGSLINSGDKILKIEAVLSGTLNYIFNTISKDITFSKSIEMAKEARFAEPDPRIDLSGTDVIRKLVILARESGYKVEQKDVKAKLFVPDKYFNGSLEDFWKTIAELDEKFEQERQDLEKNHKKYRFVATMIEGVCEVGLQAVNASHPFYDLEGSNNIVTLQTERYYDHPMIIKGYGAGASVTAAGVFGDIISIANIR